MKHLAVIGFTGLMLTSGLYLTGCNTGGTNNISAEEMRESETTAAKPDITERLVGQNEAQGLEKLEPGHNHLYYLKQFSDLDYEITDSYAWSGGMEYKLQNRQGKRYVVALLKNPDEQIIKRVSVMPLNEVPAEQLGSDVTTQQIAVVLDKLPTGNPPESYMGDIQKLGKLQEYRANDYQATYKIESNDRLYTIDMPLNARNGNVQDIRLDKQVMLIPG